MKRFYLFLLLFLCILATKAQPSADNIPNPFTDTSILPSVAISKSLYGVSGNVASLTFNPASGVTMTDYGSNNEGKAFSWTDAEYKAVEMNFPEFSLTTEAGTKYKYIYFVFSSLGDAFYLGDWDIEIGYTKYDILEGGWQLGIATLPDSFTSLKSIWFQTGSNTGWVANIFISDHLYVPPTDPAPEDLAPNPSREPGSVFSFFNDKPYGITATGEGSFGDVWNSTPSKYDFPGYTDEFAQKLVISGHGATAYKFTGTADVSAHTHIHFDIWPVEKMNSQELIIALYKKDGSDNDRSEMKINEAPPAQSWTGIDLKLSDFQTKAAGDLLSNLSKLENCRFETSGNNGKKIYYIDNIYFYTLTVNASLPQAPAYLPPALSSSWDNQNVISIFSDEYTDENATPGFSPSSVMELEGHSGNHIWKFDNSANIRATFDGGMNTSGMTHLHLDIWTQNDVQFSVKLNDAAPGFSTTTTGGEWKRWDIELPQDLSTINSIEITGDENACFIDNVYLFRHQEQFTIDNISSFNESLGRGINLGDIFEFNNGNWNPDYISMVKDLGFSHVRLPVRWENYARSLDEAPYNISPAFIKEIKAVVDTAVYYDLKIIINMHHHDKLMADPTNMAQKARFESLWEQVAGYFRYYPENLVFEILNEPNANGETQLMTPGLWNQYLTYGFDAIRSSNPNRPVLVGTAMAGGISGLNELVIPEAYENAIVTIHYYSPHNFTHQGADWSNPIPPTGTEWLDTEEERNSVQRDFEQIENFRMSTNRPIHIGEFGVYEKADMDSRVRWTTYVARYIEKKGYSWAYWEFDGKFGIYNPATGNYREPLKNALLENTIPATPSETGFVTLETLFDSNADGVAGFNIGYKYEKLPGSQGELKLKIADGGSKIWDAQIMMKQGLERGFTYRVSYIVSVENEKGFTYQSYFLREKEDPFSKYSEVVPFMPTTVPTPYSYTFFVNEAETLPENAWLTFDLGGSGTNDVIITFSDIKIEKVESRFSAAPAPPSEEVIENIYSSKYGNKAVEYSVPELVSTVKNTDNGMIILFADFEEQTISLQSALMPMDKKILHLDAYAGSELDLKVEVYSGSQSHSETFALASHKWSSLKLDLTQLLSAENANITGIKLSGGTGSGRKLYLDHIFLAEPGSVIISGSGISDGEYTSLAEAFNQISSQDQTGKSIEITIPENRTETANIDISAPLGAWEQLRIKGLEDGVTVTADNITLTGVKVITDLDIQLTSDLTIGENACLEISAGNSVRVNGTVTNWGNDGLIIKSRELTYSEGVTPPPNATFIFNQSQAGAVPATVEMYSKAFRGSDTKYRWQHIGIPVQRMKVSNSFIGSGVRQWNESGTKTGTGNDSYWIDLSNNNEMQQFLGYEVTQDDAKKIIYKGDLVSDDYSRVLNYSTGEDVEYPGQYIIGNSYTSSINIDKITFGEGLDKTVFIYNTGSFNDWSSTNGNQGGSETGRGENPGQYLAIPQEVVNSGEFSNYIPSMQGFLVRVVNPSASDIERTIGIKYSDVEINKDLQRAPRSEEESFIYTRIEVKGNHFSDRMWLFTTENSSRGFDNGWDGKKYPGSDQSPQLYAKEHDGIYQVNTVPDIQNTTLSFKAGIDEEYSLYFKHSNTSDKYRNIYLLDNMTGTVTDVTEDGSVYNFTGTKEDSEERFQILRKLVDETGPTGEAEIYLYTLNSNLYIMNPTMVNGTVYLYDISGRMLKSSVINPENLSVLSLPEQSAVYVAVISIPGYDNQIRKIIKE